MTDPSLNPSLRDLLNGISADVQLLASQTLALARLEVSAALSKLAWSAAGRGGAAGEHIRRSRRRGRLRQCAGADPDRPWRSGVGCVNTRGRDTDRRGSDLRSPLRRCNAPSGARHEGDSREPPRDDGMAETPDRHVGKKEVADRTSPSTAEMKATIGETRVRLGTRLERTADHVHVLFTAPASAQADARDGSFIGGAIKTIAVVGRTKRSWSDARRSGLLRRAAIVAATVAVAAALAGRSRRRQGRRNWPPGVPHQFHTATRRKIG
jgi:hypothetical protein